MKLLFSVLMLASVSAFAAGTIIEPYVAECSEEALATYVKVGKTKTIPTGIQVEAREAFEGDPAVWSALHMIKVQFPVGNTGKRACLLIGNASLNKLKVKSVGYSPSKGRLIRMNVTVAVGNEEGEISSKKIDLNVRVNQAAGSVVLE